MQTVITFRFVNGTPPGVGAPPNVYDIDLLDEVDGSFKAKLKVTVKR